MCIHASSLPLSFLLTTLPIKGDLPWKDVMADLKFYIRKDVMVLLVV
jgi:hypothetical protein